MKRISKSTFYTLIITIVTQFVIIGFNYFEKEKLRSDVYFLEAESKSNGFLIDGYDVLIDSVYVKYKVK